MPDAVAAQGDPASDEPVETSTDLDPTALATELATLKRRLSGKDAYYARKDAEYQARDTEFETLRKWKLEREQADMTEVQKLQAEVQRLASEAETARSEARRAKLARDFPLTFDALGDKAPLDEEALSILEKRLKDSESEAEPRIDPNNPRRQTTPPPSDEDVRRAELDQADSALRTAFGV